MSLPHPHPALDLDLIVEHQGHQVSLTGSGYSFVARFPSILSLIHFGRAAWPARKQWPEGYGISIEWRGLQVRIHGQS